MSCSEISTEVAYILGAGIAGEIGWLVLMAVVSFCMYLWSWTDDTQNDFRVNPVLSFIMTRKFGYEHNLVWRNSDDSLYKKADSNDVSYGEGAYFYGHLVIFLITMFAVVAYKFPIISVCVAVVWGGLYGLRAVKRLNKKVVKLSGRKPENSNDYTDGL